VSNARLHLIKAGKGDCGTKVLAYILRRIGQLLLTLLIFSFLVFLLLRLTGDPVITMLPPDAGPELREELYEKLGLDKPLLIQYQVFLTNAIRGDFGNSIQSRQPALDIVLHALPNSIKLAGGTITICFLLSLVAGIISVRKPGGLADQVIGLLAIAGVATPYFFVGILMIQVFGVGLRWLPVAGMSGAKGYIMPILCYSISYVGELTRVLRVNMLDVINKDFITFVRAKGVSETLVIGKHVLKNALIPSITLAGLTLPRLITSGLVIEEIFQWPGVGMLAFNSTFTRDFPVLQCIVLLVGAFMIVTSLIVDLLYTVVDPRVKYW
jgi:peptide/nickel transport system permease protein